MGEALHERLLRRADMLTELGYGGCDKELREAAAALRPPEGEVGALCERLGRGFEDASEFTVIVDKDDLRAAIALLRQLGQVEAAPTDRRLPNRDTGISHKHAV